MWAEDLFERAASGFAHWGGAGSGIKLKVDQNNVMQAARIVMAEAERFRTQVEARRAGLKVYPVGGDPVSKEAARVLNQKFWGSPDSYLERCIDYADMLEQLARQLGEAAKTYGHTEEQIRIMFDAAARDAGAA